MGDTIKGGDYGLHEDLSGDVLHGSCSALGSLLRHWDLTTIPITCRAPVSRSQPPPVQLGVITEEELKQYDGSHPKKPLLMTTKGQIYDVSQGCFMDLVKHLRSAPGKMPASRALAKVSFEDKDLTGDLSGLGRFELEALLDWEYKFMCKYWKHHKREKFQ